MSRRTTRSAASIDEDELARATSPLVQSVHSSRNPLATSLPDEIDEANGQRLVDAICKFPGRFKTASFSTTRATVQGNEIVVKVAGLNGITLHDWNRHISSRYMAGGHFSFDGLCIHIPFRKERNRKRCKRAVGGAIILCLIALAVFLTIYYYTK